MQLSIESAAANGLAENKQAGARISAREYKLYEVHGDHTFEPH
jgi:hypothetical protein